MIKKFVKVNAQQSNSDGQTAGLSIPVELLLNTDLIGAVWGSEILLIQGKILNIGGNHYVKVRLASGENINS